MVAVASAHENAVGIALWNRVIGLVLDQIAVDGSITQAPAAVKPPDVPRSTGKQGQKRSGMTDGYGIPIDRVLAGANRNDSPLLAPPLDRLDDLGLGPLPDDITRAPGRRLPLGQDRQSVRGTRPARPHRAQG
ncbi:hypothetical protein AQI84_00360 [Streptomyces griseorubiginosus]|nr:hypothetical protein AQI84_00360 [Streptomyces griseorubiginosus]